MQELTIDSVDFWYGNNQVLNNVYLNCKVGEIVGLLGRNGSGKSTLLKVIFGDVKPKFQHLKIDGKHVKNAYLTRKVAYLPQNHFIPHYLKVKDLLPLYINKHLDRLKNNDFVKSNLNETLSSLSGGERRLIEALLIIYSDADYVLLDEPFSQISLMLIEEIKKHIGYFRTLKGFIITDHHYQQLMELSSRIILIHNASNYVINDPEDLRLHQYLPS